MIPQRPIYLDNNATTPLDPEVLEAMLPFFRESFGNPSSITHSYGWEAKLAVENARESAARLIGALEPSSIVWTSGATESNNLALQGIFQPLIENRRAAHLITTPVEHKAALDVARNLERRGVEVTYVKPDRHGQVSVDSIFSAVRPHTQMISVIHANNEIGTVNPIAAIGAEARRRGILFHVDGAQSTGKIPIQVETWGIDFLSVSAHKIYGPKGIGLLYVSHDVIKSNRLAPLFYGGSQEHGLRPGTLNVPGIVGLGHACEICRNRINDEPLKLAKLRDQFIHNVIERVRQLGASKGISIQLNGHPTERVYSNISLSFHGLSADIFALGLSQIAASTGSACAAGEPSHVLAAIGLPDELARATVRLGIGRFTTPQDLELAAHQIQAMVENSVVP